MYGGRDFRLHAGSPLANSADALVLFTIAADEIGGGENGQEMGIQFAGAATSSAHAEKVHSPFRCTRPSAALPSSAANTSKR
jgi:hypothetical protein